MANLLTITKEDNEQFSFVLNSDVSNEIINTRNDLLTVGDFAHFKTSNGANLIKQQNVIYSDITLVNGAVSSVPTSSRDLFDKLTALGFFDWLTSGGGSGVDRFINLLDTFGSYLGRANKILAVSADELQITTIDLVIVTSSVQLSDMPNSITPNKLLIANNIGTAYIPIDPLHLPISTATQGAINGITGISVNSIRYAGLGQDYELPAGAIAFKGWINDGVQHLEDPYFTSDQTTFTQSGTTVTFKKAITTGQRVYIDYYL